MVTRIVLTVPGDGYHAVYLYVRDMPVDQIAAFVQDSQGSTERMIVALVQYAEAFADYDGVPDCEVECDCTYDSTRIVKRG